VRFTIATYDGSDITFHEIRPMADEGKSRLAIIPRHALIERFNSRIDKERSLPLMSEAD